MSNCHDIGFLELWSNLVEQAQGLAQCCGVVEDRLVHRNLFVSESVFGVRHGFADSLSDTRGDGDAIFGLYQLVFER